MRNKRSAARPKDLADIDALASAESDSDVRPRAATLLLERAHDERGVVAAEGERRRHAAPHPLFPRLVGDDVERALRSVSPWWMVGGITPRAIVSASAAASTAPAAPRQWPIIDFNDVTGNVAARSPNTRLNARASAASFCSGRGAMRVDVIDLARHRFRHPPAPRR